MSRDIARAAQQFFGGRVCLDFANTVDWRTSSAPQELMADYPAFLEWSARRGTLSAETVSALWRTSAASARSTERTMNVARQLRCDLWVAADELRCGRRVDPAPFNRLLRSLPAQPDIVPKKNTYLFALDGSNLQQPLWPILWSTTALLTSTDAGRIGCCNADGCGWFFVDESPNHSRLWCSSEVCGNRERARRAYAQRRVRRNLSRASRS
jgi:predicted RNA-binding Zn ribbon-like protein